MAQCPTCRGGEIPGYVRTWGEPRTPTRWHAVYSPCPDCGGSQIVSCCDSAGSAQPEPRRNSDG